MKNLFCGHALKSFSPLGGSNLKTTYNLLSHFLGPNTLKGNAKAPNVDLLRLTTLKAVMSLTVFFIWKHSPILVLCLLGLG